VEASPSATCASASPIQNPSPTPMVPEFPSTVIMSALVIGVLFATIAHKKKTMI